MVLLLLNYGERYVDDAPGRAGAHVEDRNPEVVARKEPLGSGEAAQCN
jgi:hypothetical protein